MPGGMAPVDVKSYSDHELLQLVRSKAVLMTISINLPDLDHAALAMTAAPGRRAPFTTSPSPVEVDSHFDAGLSMWAWNVPDAAKVGRSRSPDGPPENFTLFIHNFEFHHDSSLLPDYCPQYLVLLSHGDSALA